MSNIYKGLDLTNKESMKVCVDTWKDVIDGNYIKKKDCDKIKEDYKNQQKEELIMLLKRLRKIGKLLNYEVKFKSVRIFAKQLLTKLQLRLRKFSKR